MIEVVKENNKVVGVIVSNSVNEPIDYFTVERALNSDNKMYGKVTSEDFDKICEYYVSIKYNYDIPKVRNMTYHYIITHSSIGYNYVDGLESSEEYDNKVNKLIDKIITKYEDDDR